MDGAQSLHSQLLEAVLAYKMPLAAQELLKTNLPLTISGITAAGKNTIVRYLEEASDYRHVITHTTRQPRNDAVESHEYHFVDDQQMLDLVNKQLMIEAKRVHSDNVYGTSIQAYEAVVQSNHKPMLNIDVQGVEDISRYVHNVQSYFLLPASFDDWMRMMDKRGRMSHADRLRRMHSARDELQIALRSHHYIMLINQDIPQTARTILSGSHDPSLQHNSRDVAEQLIERLKTL